MDDGRALVRQAVKPDGSLNPGVDGHDSDSQRRHAFRLSSESRRAFWVQPARCSASRCRGERSACRLSKVGSVSRGGTGWCCSCRFADLRRHGSPVCNSFVPRCFDWPGSRKDSSMLRLEHRYRAARSSHFPGSIDRCCTVGRSPLDRSCWPMCHSARHRSCLAARAHRAAVEVAAVAGEPSAPFSFSCRISWPPCPDRRAPRRGLRGGRWRAWQPACGGSYRLTGPA